MRRRPAAVVIIVALAFAACSDGAPEENADPPATPQATTSASAVTSIAATTTSQRPTTTTATTTARPPADPADVRRFVWSYVPGVDSPDDLAAALAVYDASPHGVIHIVAEGGPADHAVVFDWLRRPGPWNVQTAQLMSEFGSPTGSLAQPEPWPDEVAAELGQIVTDAATATFGEDLAPLMIDLQASFLRREVERCAAERCDFPFVWYGVPEALARPEGMFTADAWSGTIWLISDTGAADVLEVEAERTAAGWTSDVFSSPP